MLYSVHQGIGDQEEPIHVLGNAYTISIIVPTRNEVDNVSTLVQRLENVIHDQFEIIFVDDSDDDTPEAIRRTADRSRADIVLLHREPGERRDGLGGAVVEGMKLARSEWIGVMDADLQHPPELVPQLLHHGMTHDTDLVLASRYRDGGDAGGLRHVRSFISKASTFSAHLMFPRRLSGVTDPMSGFFLVRRDAVNPDLLRPRGFKILLEILVRNPGMQVQEVAFSFAERLSGESKGNLREGVRYLSHLWSLRVSEQKRRFSQFLLVGGSGIIVNMSAFAAFNVHIHYLLAAILATQCSTLWNFVLTDLWVFPSTYRRHKQWKRMAMYVAMNNATLLVRGPLLYVLAGMFGMNALVSNFLSLIALTVIRFALSDSYIWGQVRRTPWQDGSYSYDIHGLLTIRSQAWLPELERFLVGEPIENPSMWVRIGRKPVADMAGVRKISYKEGLGPYGFWINIALGETTEIMASPLLRWSPHVLYTNVVEPVLRWNFARKGFALVHGACVAFDGRAYLVTARTDTGKTTTILRLLDQQQRTEDSGHFLSDDLTLVDASGRVLSYPKPLTISHHTVAAINTPLLSRKERLALLIQSRLHSRGGRRAALSMAQSRLPMATINAIVQFLVPPPKYHVQRLVPRVKALREAQLDGLIVIERARRGGIQILDEAEALEILLRNCEDAYGFPPYHKIEGFLRQEDGIDLREVESAIIKSALSGRAATLMRSANMDWAERITSMLSGPQTELQRIRPALVSAPISGD
jgi:dolichol-phosphate mannosyltransferase